MARSEDTRELKRARREQRPVRSVEGDELGHVDALYYDLERGAVAWIGIADETPTSARTLVPADGVSFGHDAVRIPYEREVVARAPQVDAEELDDPTEELLTAYFGIGERGNEHETAVLRPDDEPTAPTEETVVVGKQREEAGRVRMRKRVETEPVTVEIEIERETARVYREPLGLPVARDIELGETEVEIPFFAERPVLGKHVVAAERIRVEKDVARDTRSVDDELRVERDAEAET
ncbi:MAG TPA: YsnF/AvaK domain-containing protein [Gaiellaceae bacterium]